MNNLDLLISKNGRYMMLENIVYDAKLDRHAHIDEISFSDLIDIIGENVNFLVKNLKTDISEISSFSRKTAYHVLEYFETDSKLSLMMEYEVKFGSSLLVESVENSAQVVERTWSWIKDKTKLLEQESATFNPFNKDFYTSSNWKKAGQNIAKNVKSTAQAVTHPIDTIKKGYNWVKENGFGAMMEKVREGLSSGTGVALQVFAQFTGVGNIAVGIVWGAMLLWDLYKIFTGKEWNWLDLLFDILGILSTGVAKAFKLAAKGAGVTGEGGLAGMKAGLAKLAKNPKTAGMLKTLSGGISKVTNTIKSAGTWLSEKLGIKWIGDTVNKAEAWIAENVVQPIGNSVGLKSTVAGNARRAVAAGTKYDVQGDVIQDVGSTASKMYDKMLGINDQSANLVAAGGFK
jgi:hypothetical protein